MFDRTIETDRSRAPEGREPGRGDDGHPPGRDQQREDQPRSLRGRSGRALADVGIYACISFRDLAETHFGDDAHATRQAVDAWIRDGLARESRAEEVKGRAIQFLTLTRSGAVAARDLAAMRGLDPGQRLSAARIPRGQVAHDAAIYRACRHARQRLLRRGAAVRRVRLDGELRSRVARRTEYVRVWGGRRRADAARHRVARELGLPIDPQGHVLYPDAQIEYTRPDGVGGRVNIEVASDHYRAQAIRAKAAAGFVLYAAGTTKARVLRLLGQSAGPDAGRGGAERSATIFEL